MKFHKFNIKQFSDIFFICHFAGKSEGGDGDIAGDVASAGRGQTGKTDLDQTLFLLKFVYLNLHDSINRDKYEVISLLTFT